MCVFIIVLLLFFCLVFTFRVALSPHSILRCKKDFHIVFSHKRARQKVILLYSFVQFTKRNVNFGLLSLNGWGIRTLEKRKAFFHWLSKDKAEVVFLQETYSSPDVENVWKTQLKGDLYFAHGSEHSRGVLILVKERLNFELKSCTQDKQGRYIILQR